MKKITIGRDTACTIFINKPTVAWKHCCIKADKNGHFTVKNLDSNYETWVNGEKVEDEKYYINIDTVQVGDVTLKWDYIKWAAENENKNIGSGQKTRHGFVTFWLWLGIIVNIIIIPVGIVTYQHFANPGGYYLMGQILLGQEINPIMHTLHNHVLIMQVLCAAGGLLMIIFYSKLLHWKKIGFWGLACTSIIINVVNLIMLNAISKDYLALGLKMTVDGTKLIIISVVPIVVLWAILQIRKNGVSCWKQLE
ncbi:MAG: FHA domain-containing protein [Bacteroidales bacterium]|nr:FHA domain-containing protein [Bacteroidales bacterium]